MVSNVMLLTAALVFETLCHYICLICLISPQNSVGTFRLVVFVFKWHTNSGFLTENHVG